MNGSETKKGILNENKNAPVSWCPLPWSHVNVKGDGTFRLCCHANSSQNRGLIEENNIPMHVSNSTWDSVLNTEYMKEIRLNMLKGKWSEPCIRCQREHNSGMQSRNHSERIVLASYIDVEKYPSYNKAVARTKEDGSINIEDFPITNIDIRFGNMCNLKCTMCSPTDSNQWYDDYYALWGHKAFTDSNKRIELVENIKGKLELKNNIYDWSDDENFWKEIESHMHTLCRIYIVGGEPLLIDAHYDFLQKCVDAGYAKNLMIEYNSNITNIPQRAWSIWKHFKQIIMGVSIDAVGEVNNLIRFPSKWPKIEENLKKFTIVEGNYSVHITPTIQILNLWHLPDFIEYLITQNLKNVGPWPAKPVMTPHPLHQPSYLNINILPDDFKVKVKEKFELYKNKFKTTNYQELIGDSNNFPWENKINQACVILDNYIEYMYKLNYTNNELDKNRKNFIHFMDTLDIRRKTNWKEVLPELYNVTGSWR